MFLPWRCRRANVVKGSVGADDVLILEKWKKTSRSLATLPTGARAVVLVIFFAVIGSLGLSLAARAAGTCDYRVKDLWKSPVIKIEGIKHYLSRAVTLDLDNNRQVDNVSFTFITKDGSKEVLQYFGIAGEISGRDYPALALADESLIGRLCFGKFTYDKRQYFMEEPLNRPFMGIENPDLAGQKEAKERGVVYHPETNKTNSWVIWGAVGGLALLAAAVAGLFAIHRKKALVKEDEDEKGKKGRPDDAGDGNKEKPVKQTWPKTPDGVTDWEAVFEDSETGLIPLITQAQSSAALTESTIVVIEKLMVRETDPAEIEKFKAELTRLMHDDTAKENLPRITETVAAILRQIKEERKENAAEFKEGEKRAKGEMRAKGEDRRKRGDKRKRVTGKNFFSGSALVWGVPLIAVAIGIATYLTLAGLGSQEELSPVMRLIEEMKRVAMGEKLDTHAFGGALRTGTKDGRRYVAAEKISPKACASAGWVFANRGTIFINGVFPTRVAPNLLAGLCARDGSLATLTWFPERDQSNPQ